MNAIKHHTNNHVFGPPAMWDHTKTPCDSLSVTIGGDDDQPCIKSHWMPTADELVKLNAGHPVELSIYGRGMPPVSIGVGSKS